MSSERDMAAARAYLAHLRGVQPPVVAPDEDPAGAENDAAVQAPAPTLADTGALATAAQPLELVDVNTTLQLRDHSGARCFGLLTDIHRFDACAHCGDETCRLVIEDARRGWMITARSVADDNAVAAFYRGWRPGGDVWVAPDLWYSLRWTPLARNSTWRLATAEDEILRVRTHAHTASRSPPAASTHGPCC